MRWLAARLCRRQARRAAALEPAPYEAPSSLPEAQEARRQAEQGLAEATGLWQPVREVTGRLRDHRRENHFADQLAELFKEKPET